MGAKKELVSCRNMPEETIAQVFAETDMLETDPFRSIETTGVGGLVKMVREKGRTVAKDQRKAFRLVSTATLRRSRSSRSAGSTM